MRDQLRRWIPAPVTKSYRFATFIFITIGWFRAIWVLAGWFVLQLLMGAGTRPPEGEAGGVAFGAHVGGFVAGVVLIPLFKYADVPLFRRH